MKTVNQSTGSDPAVQVGTAASAFHLPETLDWSSRSAQIKNRLILIPAHTDTHPNSEPREPDQGKGD